MFQPILGEGGWWIWFDKFLNVCCGLNGPAAPVLRSNTYAQTYCEHWNPSTLSFHHATDDKIQLLRFSIGECTSDPFTKCGLVNATESTVLLSIIHRFGISPGLLEEFLLLSVRPLPFFTRHRTTLATKRRQLTADSSFHFGPNVL